jgi:tetratricopeptide (TPR) repeat protein
MEARLCTIALSLMLSLISIFSFAQSESEQTSHLTRMANTHSETNSIAHKLESVLAADGIASAVDMFDIMYSEPSQYSINEQEMTDLALSLLLAGKIDQSVAIWQLTVQAYPQSWQAYENLGNAYLAQLNFDAAEKCFDRATDLKSTNDLNQDNYPTVLLKIIN